MSANPLRAAAVAFAISVALALAAASASAQTYSAHASVCAAPDLAGCGRWVPVAIPDERRAFVTELLARALPPTRPPPLPDALALPPLAHEQLEQEVMKLVADLTGLAGVARTGTRAPVVAQARALRDIGELERAHVRATTAEVERYVGTPPKSDHRARCLLAGIGLFLGAGALHVVIDGPATERADGISVRPKILPGIKVTGRFSAL